MSEPVLFDMEPAEPADPEPKLSEGRRRTIRQQQMLARGRHPLGFGGAPIRLHPDAPPADDRIAPGPRCGSCRFISGVSSNGNRYYLKCSRGSTGEIGTPSFRRGPWETHGAASDLRAWWPGCQHWTPAETDHAGHERDDTGEFPGGGLTCLDCSGPEDQAPRVQWTTRETEKTGAA